MIAAFDLQLQVLSPIGPRLCCSQNGTVARSVGRIGSATRVGFRAGSVFPSRPTEQALPPVLAPLTWAVWI